METSVVFTFAVQKHSVQNLIPPCLELDTFNDEWAFIAVAMVQTKNLKPKGLPNIFGNDFFLIGYRVFVKYLNSAGKRLRGLYIIKSETNKKQMEWLGNIFTNYQYTTTNISVVQQNHTVEISSEKSNFKVVVETDSNDDVGLPSNSPFLNWKEARRFAGPLPFTFSYNAKTNKVLIVEGVRQNWTPKPVHVLQHHFSLLDEMSFQDRILANAFLIENIPYYWKKGVLEQWTPR